MTKKKDIKKEDYLEISSLTTEQIYEKEHMTEDVLTNVYSLIFILESIVTSRQHSDECKIIHMTVLIENIFNQIRKLEKYYGTIKYFNEIEQDYYDSKFLLSPQPLTNSKQS